MKKHKKNLLKTNPKFRKTYWQYSLWFEIGQWILEVRSWLNMKLRKRK